MVLQVTVHVFESLEYVHVSFERVALLVNYQPVGHYEMLVLISYFVVLYEIYNRCINWFINCWQDYKELS